VEKKMIPILEMEDVIYSHVAEEKMIQSQTIMKKKVI
jgi:predicted RNA-binding protein